MTLKVVPAPGKGRYYARCVYTGRGSHNVQAGEPCMPCERDYEDALRDWHKGYRDEPVRPRRRWLADHPAFVTMCQRAIEIGWPEHYTRDLTDWDRWWLAARFTDPREPFAWVLRECGTHVIGSYDPSPTGYKPTDSGVCVERLAEIFTSGAPHHYFVWDGTHLAKARTPKTADNVLDDWGRSWRRLVASEKARATA